MFRGKSILGEITMRPEMKSKPSHDVAIILLPKIRLTRMLHIPDNHGYI